MSSVLELTLGIMTAVGGFVDVSELVFAAQAGSRFLFALIWVFALGTVGIMVFGEMGGRVAAISKQPVFNLMRQRLGLRLGMLTLLGAVIVNGITCAAEIGGLAIVLKLLLGWPYRLLAVLVTALLIASIWILPFKWIERVFGLLGLFMLTFLAATAAIDVPWKEVAAGFIPSAPVSGRTMDLLSYAYFAVAIISAVIFPYEVYFYSSGGIEEHWSRKDLPINRITTIVGFALGSLLAISLLINAAVLFSERHIDPQLPATVALQSAIPFGKVGLMLALSGMFFAFAGAAIETCLSNGYCIAQFFGWEWGRYKGKAEAPRFTVAWLTTFGVALAIVLTGIGPLDLVEYAVVSSILVLPLTYFPLLLVASDEKYMGKYANGIFANFMGWLFFIIVTVAAVAALPLFFITSGGRL
jgi:Mn2+/Fe2+ NRAMP family transporter